MEHATQVELIERILAHVDEGTRDMAAGIATNPVSDYFDADKHGWERRTLFRDYPILMAHVSQLREAGDFVTHDETGVPVLIVRRPSGEIGAYLNVCRHRGAVIVRAREGRGRRTFVCPYHAWSYDAEGRLMGITDGEGFEGVDPGRHGLVSLPVAERHGFVWVRPAPGAAIDIDAYLGPLAKDFASYGLASHTLYRPAPDHVHEEIEKHMNWKLMVDTFLEAYHFRWTHSASVYPLFTDNVGLFERFGRHIRIVIPKRTVLDLPERDRAEWDLREHSIILYHLFPNTVVVLMADHASVFAMFPRGAEDSVLLLSFYLLEEPSSEEARAYWKKNADLIRAALKEDFYIGEGAQRAFHSGANAHLTYGRYEKGLDYFHRAVNAALAEAGYNAP